MKTKVITSFREPDTDQLIRQKSTLKFYGNKLGIVKEYRIGILMFCMLNFLLALFNGIDIGYVWIHFEWNGALLKEFVHEGTYFLIFTLFISMGLVLFFFRKNLNFYSKNKTLRLLANIWLVQNRVMAISVLVRNFHYIQFYNLAYLRIGVIWFVILRILGLISVLIKINRVKNAFYLIRMNMLLAYCSLVLFSLPDWDVLIAKYNFSRSENAFVHLNFVSELSDKALPYLDKTDAELESIKKSPVYNQIGNEPYFMTFPEYQDKIERRKSQFIQSYPKQTIFEWNFAEYKAYRKLFVLSQK